MGTRRRNQAKLTAKEVLTAVEAMYGPPRTGKAPRWARFREFRVGTGYGRRYGYDRNSSPAAPEQRIDLFVMSCWPSDLFERVAYEVKVNRSDWTSELRDPYKRMAAYRMSNRFYFAAPVGLVRKDEVPVDCGLVEVHQGPGEPVAKVTLKAAFHESDAPTWMTVAAMARRTMDRGNVKF